MDNTKRSGRFTSSEIYRLFGSERVRQTYVEETIMEKRLGKTLNVDFFSKAATWGTLMEFLAFNELGFEYSIVSKETIVHYNPEFAPYWSGTPDYQAKRKAGECKGYQYKKWCKLTDTILSKDLPRLKKYHPKEFWQCVSNAILLKGTKAEIISYMPYESEFETIQAFVAGLDISGTNELEKELHERCGWVQWEDSKKVALLPDGGYYKKLNRFEFDVPIDAIKELNARVRQDLELLKD